MKGVSVASSSVTNSNITKDELSEGEQAAWNEFEKALMAKKLSFASVSKTPNEDRKKLLSEFNITSISQGVILSLWERQQAPATGLGGPGQAQTQGDWSFQQSWHNLLREGIEPNPGPAWVDIMNKVLTKHFGTAQPEQEPDGWKEFNNELDKIAALLPKIFGKPNADKLWDENISWATVEPYVLTLCREEVPKPQIQPTQVASLALTTPATPESSALSDPMEIEPSLNSSQELHSDIKSTSISKLITELSHCPNIRLPEPPSLSYYQPKANSFLKPNIIPSFERIKIHFALLEGHLGDKNGVSQIANALIEKATENVMLRLRGPSGIGKTKALFDVLRKKKGVFLDLAAYRVEKDIAFFFKRLMEYREMRDKNNLLQTVFEDWCGYEFCLIVASRLVAVLLLRTCKPDLTPSDVLHLQVNGLAAGKYEYYLLPIRDSIRRRCEGLPALQTLIKTIYQEFPFVLCVDEINITVGMMKNEFNSITLQSKSRPLISLVIKTLGSLEDVPIIVSGTGKIQDQVDYFRSMTARNPHSPAEVSRLGKKFFTEDLMALNKQERRTFLNNISTLKPNDSIYKKLLEDGSRPRFITSALEALEDETFYGVAISTYDQWRDMMTMGKKLQDISVTPFGQVASFHAVNPTLLEEVFERCVMDEKKQFRLPSPDVDLLQSNLMYLLKKDAQVYVMDEALIWDALCYFLLVNNFHPADFASRALIKNPKVEGHIVEHITALQLLEGWTINLPNNVVLEIERSKVCHYGAKYHLKEFLEKKNGVYSLKEHERIDFVAPARVKDMTGLDVSPPFQNQKEWSCYVFISQKTRQGHSIDDREVFDGYATTQLRYFNSQKVVRDEEVRWEASRFQKRLEVYDLLKKEAEDKNLLIVRIHFLFPCGPFDSNAKEDHRLSSWQINRQIVQLKWKKLFEENTLTFVELGWNIDSTTLPNWNLFSEVVQKSILNRYPPRYTQQELQKAYPLKSLREPSFTKWQETEVIANPQKDIKKREEKKRKK